MFHIWGQIDYFWEKGVTPIHLFYSLNPHMLRYALIYPVLWISEALNISPDIIFSIFMCLCLIASFLIYIKIIHYMKINGTYFNISMSAFIFLTVLIVMFANGRGVLAILGVLLLFFLQYRWDYLSLPKIILLALSSLLLTSVSNGTFVAFILSMMLFLPLKLKLKILRYPFIIRILLLIFIPLIATIVEKNLLFYNGNCFALLLHGPFSYTITNPFLTIALTILLTVYYYILLFIIRPLLGLSSVTLIVYSIVGLFGILTFASILPILLILSIYSLFYFHNSTKAQNDDENSLYRIWRGAYSFINSHYKSIGKSENF